MWSKENYVFQRGAIKLENRKKAVIDYYLKATKIGKIKIIDIAEKFNVSERTIRNYLKDVQDIQEKIIFQRIEKYFYEEHMTLNEIEGLVNVSFKTIRKYLLTNKTKYDAEIANRRNRTKENTKRRNKGYKVAKRKSDIETIEALKEKQRKNAISMSSVSRFNDIDIVFNCKTQYEIKKKNNRYIMAIKKECMKNSSSDMPSYIIV